MLTGANSAISAKNDVLLQPTGRPPRAAVHGITKATGRIVGLAMIYVSSSSMFDSLLHICDRVITPSRDQISFVTHTLALTRSSTSRRLSTSSRKIPTRPACKLLSRHMISRNLLCVLSLAYIAQVCFQHWSQVQVQQAERLRGHARPGPGRPRYAS
jgi:hypothetical protein